MCRKQESANAKRQRTSSRSASPTVDKQLAGDESEDGASMQNGSSKKPRTMPVRNQREKTEKEEKERQKAEAANRRKGRAERRRADGTQATILVKASEAHADTDSDPSEEMPLAARALANRSAAEVVVQAADAAPSSHPTPDTPPADTPPAGNSRSKGGKPTHKKKGRNQYSKDREGREEESPVLSQSRDVQDSHHTPSGNHKAAGSENVKTSSKPRAGMSSRVTLTEMKRRVTGMFDFISKTQLELAGETPPEPAHESRRSSRENGLPSSLPLIRVNGGSSSPKRPPDIKERTTSDGEPGPDAKEFRDLSCVEMMDFLTRDLVHWQSQFAA